MPSRRSFLGLVSAAAARAAFRDDAVTNPPATDALLAGAPARDGRFFRVPKIIE